MLWNNGRLMWKLYLFVDPTPDTLEGLVQRRNALFKWLVAW